MFEPTGEARPCPRFQGSASGWNGSSSLGQILHAPELQKVRAQMLAGESVPGCRHCQVEEALGIPSLRNRAFTTPALATTPEVYLTYIEITVGRVCNLKCRTCGSLHSTKWEQEELELGIHSQHKTHDWLEDFNFNQEDFARLRTIKITGGEPLLSRSLPKFFDRLLTTGLAQKIKLQLYTNATIQPSAELLAQLAGFQEVHLYLSIDGCGPVNEYLRPPSQWSNIQEVIQLWLAWQAQNSHVNSSLAHTLSLLNLLSFADFLAWRRTLQPQPGLVLQIVHWPQALSLSSLSLELQEILAERLAKKILTLGSLDAAALRALDTVRTLLQTPTRKNMHLSEFYSEVERLDRVRGENFRRTFAELNALLEQN